VNSSPCVVAVIVPGDGRMRFCGSEMTDLETGDWVEVDGPLAGEPGQVAFAADRVDIPPDIELESSIHRRLTDQEITSAKSNADRAVQLVEKAVGSVAVVDARITLMSLRFTLGGDMLLCRCFGPEAIPPESLMSRLSTELGVPVQLEWSDHLTHSTGSLGRIDARYAASARVIRERLGVDSAHVSYFPKGWPRLGSEVGTPHGSGTFLGMSVRHHSARIRLESGDEVDVPLGELVKPGR
jgi:hypothetical protein